MHSLGAKPAPPISSLSGNGGWARPLVAGAPPLGVGLYALFPYTPHPSISNLVVLTPRKYPECEYFICPPSKSLSCVPLIYVRAPPSPRSIVVAQPVKNLPSMQVAQVGSLGGEDRPEKGMATESSFLDWRIPRTEEPGGLQSMGWQRFGHD